MSPLQWARGWPLSHELSGVPSDKGTNPIMRAAPSHPHLHLTITPMSHLQIPSQWGLRLWHTTLGVSIQSTASWELFKHSESWVTPWRSWFSGLGGGESRQRNLRCLKVFLWGIFYHWHGLSLQVCGNNKKQTDFPSVLLFLNSL